MICFGYIIVNTLHKGNNNNNNNNNNNSNNNNNNNNNDNEGSRGMGEVAPLYGVDSALVLTNPGVQ